MNIDFFQLPMHAKGEIIAQSLNEHLKDICRNILSGDERIKSIYYAEKEKKFNVYVEEIEGE